LVTGLGRNQSALKVFYIIRAGIKRRRAFVLCGFKKKSCLILSRKSSEKTCIFKNLAIGNQHGFEGSNVLPKKYIAPTVLILKKWSKLFTFHRKCLQNCQKVMFCPRFLSKGPKKFKFCSTFCTKVPPDPRYLRLSATCLHEVACGYRSGRGWVLAFVCSNKTGRG